MTAEYRLSWWHKANEPGATWQRSERRFPAESVEEAKRMANAIYIEMQAPGEMVYHGTLEAGPTPAHVVRKKNTNAWKPTHYGRSA